MEAGQYCTFVIHRDGAVSACGKGSYGRLGLGTSSSQPVPCRLTFDQCRTFRRVSSSKGSDGHTLALTVDGQVYSWGDGKFSVKLDSTTKVVMGIIIVIIIKFRVRHSRGKMYIGHDHLCVCVCLSVCPSPHSHTTARTWM